MPFNESNKCVSLYNASNVPSISSAQRSTIDKNAFLMKLTGGEAGGLGEKSYKPKVELFFGQIVNGFDIETNPPTLASIPLKEENDCGYAIKILEDVNNQSKVSINYLNSNSGINIYSSNAKLAFETLYTGNASHISPTTLSNGYVLNDFTVFTNGSEQISVVQDTELGLNKNYLDFTPSANGDYGTKFIKHTTNILPNNEQVDSIFNVFVSEIDVNDGYTSFIVGNLSKSSLSASANVTIQIEASKLFDVGDIIRIQDKDNVNNYLVGTVVSYSSPNLTFSFTNKETILTDRLNAGSSVFINGINDWKALSDYSNCLSTCFTEENGAETVISLRDRYTASNLIGFRYKHLRTKTNNGLRDYSNKISFTNNSFNQQTSQKTVSLRKAVGDEILSFERIGNRSYIKSQYNGKSSLINKNKFSIISYGFYKVNGVYRYFNGYYKNFSLDPTSYSEHFLTNPRQFLLTAGCSTYLTTYPNYRRYFSHKLYEILSYRNIENLQSLQPCNIIVDNLMQKYQNKAFFSPSEMQSNYNIYYSKADRPNIYGKVNILS